MTFNTANLFRFLMVPAAAACLTLAGCGGGSSSVQPTATPVTQNQSAEAAPTDVESGAESSGSASSNDTGRPHKPDEVWTDANGNKFLGAVPFDAFYDQPYTVASNGAAMNDANPVVAGTDSTGSGMGSGSPPDDTVAATDTVEPTTTATSETPPTATADSGVGEWEEMISIVQLDAEITSIRNFLGGTVQSVGAYNSSMLMIEPKAASIAVLAGILMSYPGDVAWKDDAIYVRDLAKRMTESPLQRGKKDQARLQKLFENMTDTFNRSRPAGLEEPNAEDGFVDVAPMRFVMMRMAEAEKKMKTEAGSESAFGSKKDMITHEAAILRTFTHVISREEYGYGDDAEFVGYANSVIDAAKTIQGSVEANDFGTYELALSKISTSCQQCHSVFKNN